MQKKILFFLFFFAVYTQSKATEFITWDISILNKVKNSKEYNSLYSEAIKKANAYISAPPLSVMYKKRTFTDVNKHNYQSISTYCHPNTFTKSGYPYVIKDGIKSQYIKDYDFSNLLELSWRLSYLSIAYYLTNKTLYSEKAVELLKVWFICPSTRMFPNFDYTQVVPSYGKAKGNSYGVIDMYWLIPIINSIQLLKYSQGIQKETYILIQKWFSELLNWCLTSEIGSKGSKQRNNIGTAFDVTVASIAYFANQPYTAKKILHDFEEKRIDKQIQTDGTQPKELIRTNSISYSIANLRYMMDMKAIAQVTHTYINFNKVQLGIKWLMNSINNLDQYQYKQISGYKYLKKDLCILCFREHRYQKNRNNIFYNFYLENKERKLTIIELITL